jgi:hypothetical protein
MGICGQNEEVSSALEPRPPEEAWDAVVQAEKELMIAIAAFTRSGPEAVDILRRQLRRVGQRAATLRVILELEPEVVQQLLPELVTLAGTTHGEGILARRAIGELPQTRRGAVTDIVLGRLASADSDEYRRLAELLWHIGDRGTLAQVTTLAQASADPEIREVGEDFGEGS